MLSGGQQQRVAIARALGTPARMILADEPTGNLDTENSNIVVELLKKLAHDNDYCVVMVTHDVAMADMADVALQMTDGRLG
jgi:putative ABC transport system ATP-binding protein